MTTREERAVRAGREAFADAVAAFARAHGDFEAEFSYEEWRKFAEAVQRGVSAACLAAVYEADRGTA